MWGSYQVSCWNQPWGALELNSVRHGWNSSEVRRQTALPESKKARPHQSHRPGLHAPAAASPVLPVWKAEEKRKRETLCLNFISLVYSHLTKQKPSTFILFNAAESSYCSSFSHSLNVKNVKKFPPWRLKKGSWSCLCVRPPSSSSDLLFIKFYFVFTN